MLACGDEDCVIGLTLLLIDAKTPLLTLSSTLSACLGVRRGLAEQARGGGGSMACLILCICTMIETHGSSGVQTQLVTCSAFPSLPVEEQAGSGKVVVKSTASIQCLFAVSNVDHALLCHVLSNLCRPFFTFSLQTSPTVSSNKGDQMRRILSQSKCKSTCCGVLSA